MTLLLEGAIISVWLTTTPDFPAPAGACEGTVIYLLTQFTTKLANSYGGPQTTNQEKSRTSKNGLRVPAK